MFIKFGAWLFRYVFGSTIFTIAIVDTTHYCKTKKKCYNCRQEGLLFGGVVMHIIQLPDDSAVMFVKCSVAKESICDIPDIVSGNKNSNGNDIKFEFVKSEKKQSLPIKDFGNYYKTSTKITREDFMHHENKYVFFTIDFQIEQMINLQYVLVLDKYFKKNNINYFKKIC